MWPFFYVSQIRHWTFEQKTYDRRYYAQKQNIPSDKDQGFEGKARAFFAIFIWPNQQYYYCFICSQKNRYDVLLSILHQVMEIADNTEKPEIIQFYNKTKPAVYTLDQVIRNYTC